MSRIPPKLSFIEPQLASPVDQPPEGNQWIFSDPARFSLAHGGKDRHPFPVPLRVYDETIRTLKTAIQNARLGREEELGVLKRLDQQARELEVWAKAPSFEAFLAEERQASPAYGGRSLFGWERDAGRNYVSHRNAMVGRHLKGSSRLLSS
jgi:hypothetical protein